MIRHAGTLLGDDPRGARQAQAASRVVAEQRSRVTDLHRTLTQFQLQTDTAPPPSALQTDPPRLAA